MDLKTINISLDKGAYIPERAFEDDAGLDLRSPFDFVVPPFQRAAIDTGVHVEIPKGYAGFMKSKSGLYKKKGVMSDGTIDAGYTGSIVVFLYNVSREIVEFSAGDKISQLVIQKIETPKVNIVNEIKGLERGLGGFGSTGR